MNINAARTARTLLICSSLAATAIPGALSASGGTASAEGTATGVTWSTFLGGGATDYGLAVAADGNGYVYVVGATVSTDYPVTGSAFQRAKATDWDVVVTKLRGDGSGVVWSTFLGGNAADYGRAVAVDGAGDVYVAGTTASTDFPTTAGAYRRTNAGGSADAFVVKLSADGGTLRYSTYVGGNGNDLPLVLNVDGNGNAVMGGFTGSTNYPTTAGVVRASRVGGFFDTADGFVTKLNPSGSGLVYSTLLGSDTGTDEVFGLALDGQGQATVVGMTQSTDYPTTAGAYSRTSKGYWDGFVTRLNASGTGYVYSTFLPGSGYDEPQAVAVDGNGAAYVTGRTTSTDFPVTAGAAQRGYGGGQYDGFVTKLNASGSGLSYSTLLGGGGTEQSSAIVVTTSGEACVAGTTDASNFPVTSGSYDATANGGQDLFVARLAADGTGCLYGTYLGGSADDLNHGLALLPDGELAVTGYTMSNTFPVTSQAYDPTQNSPGAYDAFAALIRVGITQAAAAVDPPAGSPIAAASVWPNPFVERAAVSLSVARPMPMSVRILDVRGRVVRTLAKDESVVGSRQWQWDGLDDRGHDAGVGIFYLDSEAGVSRATKTIVRIR